MSQEVIEITEREIEVIEVVEKGPAGPVGPQANINYTVVSSPQTLGNSQNIAADTSGGSFTLTLPASPNAGDSIDIFDYSETFDTNPLTIARNGENIESIAEDLICNVEGAYFTMIYTGSTRGWQILPRYGTTGGGGESVLTTEGDMVYRGAAINERLPIGTAGQILKVNSGGNAPEWGAAPATGVTSVGVTGSDGIEVDSGSPVTGSGTIALGINAATLRSHINVADGAEVNVQADWDATTGDAAILNKPSTFTPSVHAALHEPTESDELMAQAAVVTTNVAGYNGVYFWDWSELVGGRPVFYKVGSRKNYKLEYYVTNTSWRLIINTIVRAESDPDGDARPWGDVLALEYAPAAGSDITEIAVTRAPLEILAQYSAERASGVSTWSELENKPSTFTPSAHTHTAADIDSGTLAHERGGLEADVSAYDGLVKISGGSTSAVTLSSAGEALLDDADATAQRTTLGLGTAATVSADQNLNTTDNVEFNNLVVANDITAPAVKTLTLGVTDDLAFGFFAEFTAPSLTDDRECQFPDASGTIALTADIPDPSSATPQALGTAAAGTSDDYSRADHVHGAPALNDLSNVSAAAPNDNDVLVYDTATSTWVAEAPAAGGVSAIGTSAADVLSVSGSDLVADDGGTVDDADPFIKWDDTAGKLVYANPLSRPSGAFYVGLAPTTTALGNNAVYISPERTAETQVASANNAVCIGPRSTASNAQAVAIGWTASATGASSIAITRDSIASGAESIALGRSAVSNGQESVAIARQANASATYAAAIGRSASASLRAEFATIPFNAVYWGGETTDATPTILNLDATATNRFTIAANTALAVDVLLVARRSDTADKWLVARRFLGIRRDGSNNTSLIGSVQTLGTDQSDGSPTWTFTLTADDTNEALQLEVTGAASETVQWRATAFYRVV